MIRLDKSIREISGNSSFFLDFIRISAAIVVLIFHLYLHWLPNEPNAVWLGKMAHTGVIIFFVLSGYVIAYTTIKNNRGGAQFFQARLSRLYSVVAPALIISAVCQVIVYFLNPSVYEHITRGASIPRYIMSGLFINEIWFFSAAPPINGPLWSLSFEFWYYIIFGFFIYRGKGLIWILPCLIVCLIAGPKILLLMPVWLMGYFAYRCPRLIISKRLSWKIVLALLSGAIILGLLISPMPNKIGTEPWLFASEFLTDWMTGIIIALALWALPSIIKSTKENLLLLNFRKVADLTFPIYVLHAPLIILWDVLFHPKVTNPDQLWIPFIGVLIITSVIGLYLEKYRFVTTNLFKLHYNTYKHYKERYQSRMRTAQLP
jgi:peptidoglycan/LPS O-acetylase OafA/YrhL